MGGLFGGLVEAISSIFTPAVPEPPPPPKPKAPPPPPEPVTKEDKGEDLEAAREEDRERRKTQRGRASTVLAGKRSDGVMGDDAGGVATKKLLGK